MAQFLSLTKGKLPGRYCLIKNLRSLFVLLQMKSAGIDFGAPICAEDLWRGFFFSG